MKRILITGCAGFIGSNLTAKLLQENYFVVGMDNLNDYYNPLWKLENMRRFKNNKNFCFIKGDILNADLLNKLFKQHRFDLVVHLAARAGVRPSILNPKLYEEVNIRGTLNVLDLSKEYKIKKFIFASSSSVYGDQYKVPFSENDSVNNPISPYAATKKASELICYTYSHLYNLSTICLRFFTVYGPGGRPDMAPYLFTKAILTGKPIKKFGDGTTSRDYTYINDIVEGISSAIDFKCKYEIFNLGNSHPVILNDFINNLENITGVKAIIENSEIQSGDVITTYADISKARKYLRYNPHTNLYEGLSNFVDWYKKNRLKNTD